MAHPIRQLVRLSFWLVLVRTFHVQMYLHADTSYNLAFFLLFMSIASAMFFVCSLRTNIVFVFIFLLLTTTFALLAAAYWVLAQGMTTLGARIETV